MVRNYFIGDVPFVSNIYSYTCLTLINYLFYRGRFFCLKQRPLS